MMGLLAVIISIIVFFVGIGLLFGSSWSFFLMDLIGTFTGTGVQGGYVGRDKESYKGSKNPKARFVGVILILISFLGFFFGLSIV